jgi:integrase
VRFWGIWKSLEVTAQSRNLRLSAIRSSAKRPTRACSPLSLIRPEIYAELAAPDQKTWFRRGDHALLLAVHTGLRLSELTGLQRNALALSTGAYVRCVDK